MPELPSEKFQTFGKAVKAARVLKSMTLDQAAFACLGRDNAKGFFSQIENGKRQITPLTAGKIITALGMNPTLIEPFLGDDEVAEDEVTKVDVDAEKLIEKAKADDVGSVTGERLLIDLAYDFAQGQHTDLFTAYKGLRAALQAARELKEQGKLPQNTSSQLDAVLRRVSEMNEAGDRDGAAEYLAEEEKRLEAEAEALFDAQLKQDRVRNRPDLAAKRLYKHITRKAHEAGEKRVHAIDKVINEWTEKGDENGDTFALLVALALALKNNEAAGVKFARHTLPAVGWCYYRLAERSSEEGLLNAAQSAFQTALKEIDPARQPWLWSTSQTGLAGTLREIATRNRDVSTLREAVSIHRAVLMRSQKNSVSFNPGIAWTNLGYGLQKLAELTADPALASEAVDCHTKSLSLTNRADDLDWKSIRLNLGLALRWLGELTKDTEILRQAREAYRECEVVNFQEKAAMSWAKNQWNISDLALARFVLHPDPALLVEAREYVMRARDFFVEGSEYQTQLCDELIARIDAIELAA